MSEHALEDRLVDPDNFEMSTFTFEPFDGSIRGVLIVAGAVF